MAWFGGSVSTWIRGAVGRRCMAKVNQFSWSSSWLVDENNAYATTHPGLNLPANTAGCAPGAVHESISEPSFALPQNAGPGRSSHYVQMICARSAVKRTVVPSTMTLDSSRPAASKATNISSGPSGGNGNTHAQARHPLGAPPRLPVLINSSIGTPCSSFAKLGKEPTSPPAVRPSANRTPMRGHPPGPREPSIAIKSPTLRGSTRKSRLIMNPFGYTSRRSTTTATTSF